MSDGESENKENLGKQNVPSHAAENGKQSIPKVENGKSTKPNGTGTKPTLSVKSLLKPSSKMDINKADTKAEFNKDKKDGDTKDSDTKSEPDTENKTVVRSESTDNLLKMESTNNSTSTNEATKLETKATTKHEVVPIKSDSEDGEDDVVVTGSKRSLSSIPPLFFTNIYVRKSNTSNITIASATKK